MKRRGVHDQNRPSGRRAPRERPIHLDHRFSMKLLELISSAMDWTWLRAVCMQAKKYSKSLPGTSSTADVLPLARISTEILFAEPPISAPAQRLHMTTV